MDEDSLRRTQLTINEKQEILWSLSAKVKRKLICRKYNIANSTVSKIIKSKAQIENHLQNNSGNAKRARKSDYPSLDTAMLEWYNSQRSLNVPLNGPILLQKANQIAQKLNIQLAKGVSEGWICRFKKRYNIWFSVTKGGSSDDSETAHVKEGDTSTIKNKVDGFKVASQDAVEIKPVVPRKVLSAGRSAGLKRNSLSLRQKHDIIGALTSKRSSKKEICSKYRIAPSTVRLMLKRKTQIEQDFVTYSGKLKRKRACEHPELDVALFDWILQQREISSEFQLTLTRQLLLKKGNELTKELKLTGNLKNGTVTTSWIDRFKDRHGILFGSETSQEGDDDDDQASEEEFATDSLMENERDTETNAAEAITCDNCLSAETPDTFKSHLIVTSEPGSEVTTVYQALTLIYALDSYAFEKKEYHLCPHCLEILVDLYKLYCRFKDLTQKTSRIHTAIEFSLSAYLSQHDANNRSENVLYAAHSIHNPNPADENPVEIKEDEVEVARLRLKRKHLRLQLNRIYATAPLHQADSIDIDPLRLDTNGFAEVSSQDDDAGGKDDHDETWGGEPMSTQSKCKRLKVRRAATRVHRGAKVGTIPSNSKKNFNKTLYDCPQCELKMTSGWSLYVHVRKNHKGLRPFACTRCPKTFATPAGLSDHLRVLHAESNGDGSQVKKYACPAEGCGRRFNYHSTLHTHSFIHNPDARKFKCTLCDQTYGNSYYLKVHMIKHNAEKNVICELCGATFKSKNNLRTHKRYLHPDQYEGTPYPPSQITCHICSKRFIRPANMRLHIRTVHDHIKPHLCNFCGHGFSNRGNLNSHSKGCQDRQEIRELNLNYHLAVAVEARARKGHDYK